MDQSSQVAQAVVTAMQASRSGPFGVSWEGWAIVLATFVGPIGAIVVSTIIRKRSSLRERRFWIFHTLMSTRRRAMTLDHVTAINLIELDFYKVPNVLQAWKNYLAHLNSIIGLMDFETYKKFENVRMEFLAKLLSQIASHLKYNMGEIDLKNGGYSPMGFQMRDNIEMELRDLAASLLRGESVLRVVPEKPKTPSND